MNAPSSAPLRFIYRNASGESSERHVFPWVETGHYIEGHDASSGGALRTFRKDRVQQYLDGSAERLLTPYSAPPPRPERSAAPDTRPQMLFTGFPKAQRAALEAQAGDAGLRVVQTVTHGLAFLVCGATAGPTKIAKARAQGVYIVSVEHLPALLETGELLDELPAAVGADI